jgi:hypothetical protein
MSGRWRDPADTNNAARSAKEVRGFRRTCMLRWCRQRHGDRSAFSVEHVVAADDVRGL